MPSTVINLKLGTEQWDSPKPQKCGQMKMSFFQIVLILDARIVYNALLLDPWLPSSTKQYSHPNSHRRNQLFQNKR